MTYNVLSNINFDYLYFIDLGSNNMPTLSEVLENARNMKALPTVGQVATTMRTDVIRPTPVAQSFSEKPSDAQTALMEEARGMFNAAFAQLNEAGAGKSIYVPEWAAAGARSTIDVLVNAFSDRYLPDDWNDGQITHNFPLSRLVDSQHAPALTAIVGAGIIFDAIRNNDIDDRLSLISQIPSSTVKKAMTERMAHVLAPTTSNSPDSPVPFAENVSWYGTYDHKTAVVDAVAEALLNHDRQAAVTMAHQQYGYGKIGLYDTISAEVGEKLFPRVQQRILELDSQIDHEAGPEAPGNPGAWRQGGSAITAKR
jgi:hypothetical protein